MILHTAEIKDINPNKLLLALIREFIFPKLCISLFIGGGNIIFLIRLRPSTGNMGFIEKEVPSIVSKVS